MIGHLINFVKRDIRYYLKLLLDGTYSPENFNKMQILVCGSKLQFTLNGNLIGYMKYIDKNLFDIRHNELYVAKFPDNGRMLINSIKINIFNYTLTHD